VREQDKVQDTEMDDRVLDGMIWPALKMVIQVGRECSNPLEGGSYDAQMSKVTKVERVDGGVCVERADGTQFELINCGLAFVYKVNPLRVALSPQEIQQLGGLAWQVEIGNALSDEAAQKYRELFARAEKHGQINAAKAHTAKLRADAAKDNALRELAGIKPLGSVTDVMDDLGGSEEEAEAREMLAGVQNGD